MPKANLTQAKASRGMVFLLFLCSGASALAYEILWTRQLALWVGATTPALSVVLSVFMGGLALGAWWFGTLADRHPRPLRLYALLEGGIGLFALAQPLWLEGLGKAYLHLLHAWGPHGAGLMALRLGLASLTLVLPTFLMGGTLPVLLRFLAREDEALSTDLGGLYAVNLLGTVLGSALTGFLLVRFWGIRGTLLGAVAVNLGVGLVAWGWDARGRGPRPVESPREGAMAVPDRRRVLLAAAVASGFFTMGYQVAWTRVLVFAFGSTVYTFTLVLIAFLLGLAGGSLLFPRLERRVEVWTLLGASQVLAAIAALGLTPLAVALPHWMNAAGARWGYSGLVQLVGTMLGACLLLLVPVALMGLVFPLVLRRLIPDPSRSGRTIGSAYWLNTLGAIAGSLAAGFLLIPMLSLKGCLAALAVAQAVTGLSLWGPVRTRWNLGKVAAALATGLALAVYARSLPGANPFDQVGFMSGGRVATLAHRDDPAGSVTVTRSENGVTSLRINGFEATADAEQGAYMPMMSHLPLLLHRGAGRVLVICFGTGSTAGSVLLHPGATVDAVDINPTVLRLAPLFSRVNHDVHRDPRARLILDDGRSYLLATESRYDLITSEPMPPTHAGVVNLYSEEYYRLAKAKLNPGGLLVQWLPFHLVTFAEAQAILRTVQEVFPETTLWMHDDTGLIVASKDAPIRLDEGWIRQAFRQSELAKDLSRLSVPTPEELMQLFALGPEEVRTFTQGIPVITDDAPSLEFHMPRHRATLVIGGYDAQEAMALESVYALRGGAAMPIRLQSEEEQVRWVGRFRMRSCLLQGQLDMSLNRPKEAFGRFQAALAVAAAAEDRALCCYHLARSARAKGDRSSALAWIERCLQEKPTSPTALRFRQELQSDPVGTGR